MQSHTFYIHFTVLGRGLALASWSQFKVEGQTSKSVKSMCQIHNWVVGGVTTRIKEKGKIKYEHNTKTFPWNLTNIITKHVFPPPHLPKCLLHNNNKCRISSLDDLLVKSLTHLSSLQRGTGSNRLLPWNCGNSQCGLWERKLSCHSGAWSFWSGVL